MPSFSRLVESPDQKELYALTFSPTEEGSVTIELRDKATGEKLLAHDFTKSPKKKSKVQDAIRVCMMQAELIDFSIDFFLYILILFIFPLFN